MADTPNPYAKFATPENPYAKFSTGKSNAPPEAPPAAASEKEMTPLERFGTGIADPVQGGAQLLSHAVPAAVSSYMNEFNNWLADKGVPLAKIPPGGMDEQTKIREEAIKASTPNPDRVETTLDAQGRASHVNRGPSKGADPLRIVGQAVSPANYAGGPLLKSAGPLAQALGMGAVTGALEPVTGKNFSAEKWKQVGAGAATGLGAGAATKILGGVMAPKLSSGAKELLDAGVELTPGQMAGKTVKRAEEAAKSVPLTGTAIRAAEGRAIDTFNLATANKALEPLGVTIPADTTGRDIIAAGKAELSNAYNTLVPQLRFRLDHQFAQDIANTRTAFDHMPQPQMEQFARIQARLRDRLLPNNKSPLGELNGDELQAQLSELTELSNRYKSSPMAGERDLGAALEQLEDKINDAVRRQNPAFAQRLDDIDRGFAMFTRVEGAAGRRATSGGRFTPGDLLGAIKSQDVTRRKGAFARGDALLQDWAQTGHDVIGNKLPDSGSPERLMWDIGGGGMAAMFNPKILAAMLGGSAAYSEPATRFARAVAQPGPRRVAARGAIDAALPYAAPALTEEVERNRK